MNREAMSATSKACASCRQQKKRCNGSCEYAELFPASRYDEFQNAQRLFGVCNIHNIIRAVDPEMRKQAAESILTEGNIRRADPVNGCLGVARRLKWEIGFCQRQLEDVNRRLSFFRQRDRELKRQQQGFIDTSVELPLLPPSFFSNGGHCGSFYEQIRSNMRTTPLDSRRQNFQGLHCRSTFEEGATSAEPFNFFPVSEPWNCNPTATITSEPRGTGVDQVIRPEEPKRSFTKGR